MSVLAGVYILIAVGAVMMLVGFLGCYGAIQESQCLLGTVRIILTFTKYKSHYNGEKFMKHLDRLSN